MDEGEDISREDIVEVIEGEEISNRWVVIEAIGSGAYGDVYHVWNKESERQGAMKIESLQAADRILKIELEVLKAYKKEKSTAIELLGFGITGKFTYIVMTLCGADLAALSLKVPQFNESTILRVALRSLISLKALHEVGYIHRDIKPSNFATSKDGSKNVYLIDFGMTRNYAYREKETQSWVLKERRQHVAFRGTIRYCSIGMHERQDQGRVDDLWGWLYMCVEMSRPLPWKNFNHPDKVLYEKKSASVAQLLGERKILTEWKPVVEHLQATGFYDRPAYEMIVGVLKKQIKERGITLLADYQWEQQKDDAEEDATIAKLRAVCQKHGKKPPPKTTTEKGGGQQVETELWETILQAAEEENIPGGGEHRQEPSKDIVELQGRSRSVVCPIVPSPSKQQKKKANSKN